jgi:biopolymer transport protein ExbB
MSIDPSRGSILGLLVQTPSLLERVDQGGLIGYIIVVIAFVGLLLVIGRMLILARVAHRVRLQKQSAKGDPGNPLGRVLAVYEANQEMNSEALELKLDEAILKETPPLERGLTTIKVLSVIAPLLGLLGTVTGMIRTFQAITLFGTGDPKLMAGGISQALVTTVLGLLTAIPLVLLHSLVRDRSKALTQLLDEQAAGLVAERAEREGEGRGVAG